MYWELGIEEERILVTYSSGIVTWRGNKATQETDQDIAGVIILQPERKRLSLLLLEIYS